MYGNAQTSLNKISPQWFGYLDGTVSVGPKTIWSSLGSSSQWPGPPRSMRESIL